MFWKTFFRLWYLYDKKSNSHIYDRYYDNYNNFDHFECFWISILQYIRRQSCNSSYSLFISSFLQINVLFTILVNTANIESILRRLKWYIKIAFHQPLLCKTIEMSSTKNWLSDGDTWNLLIDCLICSINT